MMPITRSLLEALGLLPRRGYKVSGYQRDLFLYTEGDHKLIIDGVMLTGKIHQVIRWGSTKHHWEPPHDGELITPEKRAQILERLEEHMNEIHLRYRIED